MPAAGSLQPHTCASHVRPVGRTCPTWVAGLLQRGVQAVLVAAPADLRGEHVLAASGEVLVTHVAAQAGHKLGVACSREGQGRGRCRSAPHASMRPCHGWGRRRSWASGVRSPLLPPGRSEGVLAAVDQYDRLHISTDTIPFCLCHMHACSCRSCPAPALWAPLAAPQQRLPPQPPHLPARCCSRC